MAQQLKFYSVSAAGYDGISSKNANGIYFVYDREEIYKGTTRFGGARVYTGDTVPTSPAKGDIRIPTGGVAKVYTGTEWKDVAATADNLQASWQADISNWIAGLSYASAGANDYDTFIVGIQKDGDGKLTAQTSNLAKASVGASTTTAQHGISAKVTLNRTAKPSLEMTVNAAALTPNFSTSAYFTTGSIVYGHTVGLAAGDGTKYINKIAYDKNTGKLTATASEIIHTSESLAFYASTTDYRLVDANAVKEYVDGKVTTIDTAIDAKASKGTGQATASHGVSASFNLKSNSGTHDFNVYVTPATVDANFGTSENVTTGKVVYAHTSGLAAGDGTQYINKITYANGKLTATASTTIHASTDIGSATNASRGLTDAYAVKTYVDGKVGTIGEVMHFRGAGAALPSTSTLGDVWVFTANSGTYKKGQEVVYTSTGWEVLGDQNQWVDKVTGGAKTVYASNLNSAIKLEVGTEAVTAKITTLSITGLGGAASKDYIDTIFAGSANLSALPTASAVTAYVADVVANNIPNDGASTTTSYGVTISASTVAGVQNSANITVSPITASGNMAGATSTTSMATAKAIVDYVTAKVNGLDATDIGTGTNGLSIKVTEVDGKITKASLFDNGLAKAKGDITAASTAIVTASAVHAFVGDRDTSINTKASTGTASTASNGVTISVSLYSTKAPTMSIVGLGAAASKGVIGTTLTNFSTSANLTTGSAVYTHTSGLSTGADTSYIKKIAYDASTGKLTATAAAFPTIPTVAGGSHASASKGVDVKVDIAANTAAPTVTVTTTLSTTLAADAEHAPTTKVVYEALCWYSANGNLIA